MAFTILWTPAVVFAANGFFAVHQDDKVCRLIKLDPACSAGHCGRHDDDDDDDVDDDDDDDDVHPGPGATKT